MRQNGQKGHDGAVPNISPTPLVVDIARRLQLDGTFVMHVGPGQWRSGQLQAVVDVSWAAKLAGQLLDRDVRVTTTRVPEVNDTYTVVAQLVGR